MNTFNSSKIPLGITLVFFGVAIFVVGFGISIIALAVAMSGGVEPEPLEQLKAAFTTIDGTLLWLAVAVGWCGTLLSLVGKACCVAAPADMPGKRQLYLAIVCAFVGLVASVVIRLGLVPVSAALNAVLPAGSILGWGFFAKFLEQLALHLRNQELADKAKGLLTLCSQVAVFTVLERVCEIKYSMFSFLFGLVATICGIAAIVRYVRLLRGFQAYLIFCKAHPESSD